MRQDWIDRIFWPKVRKTKDCWYWTGRINNSGYGAIGYRSGPRTRKLDNNKKYWLAHRLAFKLSGNELIKGMCLDHICRNRACVNPAHLRQVSYRINAIENSAGASAKNHKKTHCPAGHLYDKTAKAKYGIKRYCSLCK